MASQFQALGLEPAGDDGSYFQRVPLLQGERLADGARFELIRNGRIESLAFETEFLPGVNYNQPEFALTAPLVFVGQGVVAPEFDHAAIGRACGRERVCQYVYISVVAVYLKKNIQPDTLNQLMSYLNDNT